MTLSRLLILLSVIGVVGALELRYQQVPLPTVQSPQQTTPAPYVPPVGERRDDRYMDDPHARCFRPEVVEMYGASNPSLKPCTCHLQCVANDTNADGEVDFMSQAEVATCALYCSKQRCACHPDDPCSNPNIDGVTGTVLGTGVADNPFSPQVVPR